MTQTREEMLNLYTDSQSQALLGGLSPTASDVETAQSDGFGTLLLALAPTLVVRTGLTSGTTHVDQGPDSAGNLVNEAGRIHAVLDEAGAVELSIIRVGAPAVGEVLVTYDAAGVPTLTFQAAVTGYQVDKSRLPADFVAKMTQVFA
jgi:hypothetical protein